MKYKYMNRQEAEELQTQTAQTLSMSDQESSRQATEFTLPSYVIRKQGVNILVGFGYERVQQTPDSVQQANDSIQQTPDSVQQANDSIQQTPDGELAGTPDRADANDASTGTGTTDASASSDAYVRYLEACIPGGALGSTFNYPTLVSAIVRAKYSADQVEAIILNGYDEDTTHAREFADLQAWRTYAKEIAKEIFGE